MFYAKRVTAGVMAVLCAFSVASCGKTKDSSSSYVDKVKVADTEDIENIPDGAETELEWLSYFDINPTKSSPETRSDLTLFQNKGGSIKYSQTTSLEVFEKLANRLMSNDPPDMFWYEGAMTFPANCVKEMFQPVDAIVDFEEPLWSGVKGMADQYMLNGEHYVAPVSYGALSVMTYDKAIVNAAGLDDPYELYLNDEWDWDIWYTMMEEYCQGATDGEERWGVNGWFAPFFFHSTGKTLINYDAEKDEYVSNLDDPDFDRASTLLYNVKKNGMYNSNWIGQAGDAFKDNVLFYAMGSWAATGTHGPKDGDEWGVVPMPKDPNSDTKYTSVDLNAYMWIKGSTKNEAMKCWYECARIVNTQQEYIDTEREKFFASNPNWTDEMYDVITYDVISDKYVQIYDPGYGISTTLSDNGAATNDTKEALIPYMYTSVMKEDEDGGQYTWTMLREQFKGTIDSELKTFNEAYHKFTEANS